MENHKLKICHVSHQTWPSVCGSVSRLENILSAQKISGISSFVISSPFQKSLDSNADIESNNGVTYYRCGSDKKVDGVKNQRTLLERIGRAFSIIPFTKRIIDICRKENPDVIHAHATFAMGIPALISGLILNKKVVYEMRSTWEDDISGGAFISLQKKLIKYLEYLTGTCSSYVFFVSNGIRDHYFKTAPRNNQTIHNCVPPPSEQQPLKSGNYSFGYIGSIVYYEGLETLIEASAILAKRRDDFSVNFYGEGKERDFLQKMVEGLGLSSNIKFHGRIEYSDIGTAYSKINCIVLPRRDLPITQKVAGLKPIEAFSYKKLVLASNVGGMRELFTDKQHGLMFEPNSPESLAGLMEGAIDGKVNEAKIISQALLHYQKYFTLEEMGNRYLSAYRQVISK